MRPVCAHCHRYRFTATMRATVKRCPRCKGYNEVLGLSTAPLRRIADGPDARYSYVGAMSMRRVARTDDASTY